MRRKYLLKSPLVVGLIARLLAKAIDLFVVLILSVFLYQIGILAAVVYMSVADYLPNGQSIGKRFMGMAVVSLEDGTPCSLKQSFIRNLPITIPLIFAIIPFWGWLFAIFVGVPLVGFEIYLLSKLDSGHRMGDVMADTTVMAKNQSERITGASKDGWFKNTEVRTHRIVKN